MLVDEKFKNYKLKLQVCKKHSSIGCAIITFKEEKWRNMVMLEVQKQQGVMGEEVLQKGVYAYIGEISASVRPRTDKSNKQMNGGLGVDVPTDIFVGWGRKIEQASPITSDELIK